MMISTRGRYALRVMIDLAEQSGGRYIPMKDIAARQEISLTYIERIMPSLVKGGLVEGVQGKGGGYRLNRAPEDYSIGEILRLAEGKLMPVACVECGGGPCDRSGHCRTRPVWAKLDRIINDYLDGVTIADLMQEEAEVPHVQ